MRTVSFSIVVAIIFSAFGLSIQAGGSVLEIISGINDTEPVRSNMLRLEAQVLADSDDSSCDPEKMREFILDETQNPAARIFAQELFETRFPESSASLDPVMLESPNPELRYPVIARLLEKADKLKEKNELEKASVIYHALLFRAGSLEQTNRIANSLSGIEKERPLSGFGIDFNQARDCGYLIEWKVSIPYENSDGNGIDEKYPPEEFGAAEEGGSEWKTLEADKPDGKLDLEPFADGKTNFSIYARHILDSPETKKVSIRYSTQKTGKVWLNGVEIGRFPINDDGGDVPDKYEMTAELKPGRNVLLVKNSRYTEPVEAVPHGSNDTPRGTNAANTTERAAPGGPPRGGPGGGRSGWPFQIRICDETGVPLILAETAKKPPIPDSLFEKDDPEPENQNFQNDKSPLGKEVSGLDFTQFRTERHNPVFKDVPCLENVLENGPKWKVPIKGNSASSPIIVGDRVIVTSADGPGESRLHTSAFDLGSGRKLWERTIKATGSLLCYRPFSSLAAHTPASDGKRIIAMFSGNDLLCFDLEGKLLWYRPLGLENPDVIVSVGMAASPLILDGKVIVQCQSNTRSFAEALNIETSETIWKTERPKGQGWSSPTVFIRKDGSKLLVFQDRTGCFIHDPADGKMLGNYEVKCGLTCSPLCTSDTVYFASNGLTAMRFDVSDSSPEVLWSETKIAAGSASIAIDDGKLYIIKSPGILLCADAKSGEMIWQIRVPGSFYASPVVLGNHLFAVNQQGIAYHVLLGEEKGKVLEEIEIGEDVLGSPVVSEKAILIRSKTALIRFDLSPPRENLVGTP